MNGETVRGIILIIVMAAGTMLTRFLPFLLFPGRRKCRRLWNI